MAIQTTYNDTLEQFACGQMANTIPGKCESGVLTQDTSLPFGRACQWNGANDVHAGVARKSIGVVAANVSGNSSFRITLHPGMERPPAGSRIVIGTSDNTISVVGATDAYTAGSNVTASAGTNVLLINGGPTSFAGVAVRDVTITASNAADTFQHRDIVPVGTEGDFVVEIQHGGTNADNISYGDRVAVYVGSTAADYGKFSNDADGDDYIGIPGASFVSANQLVGGKQCAILRLPKQST